MPENIDDIVDNWKTGINPRYFIGHPGIPLRAQDYSTRGIRGTSPQFSPPSPIHFNKEFTPYGIVIEAPKKKTMVNAAVLGFRQYNGTVDCLQIQGGPGRYKQLTPIRWDSALLSSAIELAKKSGLDAVLVVPSSLVEGSDPINQDRVIARYDRNAMIHGFLYSNLQQRWVLEIK